MSEDSQYALEGLEKRVRDMEIELGGTREWKSGLTEATRKNTDAICDLTEAIGKVVNTLSYNKGAFWMGFRFLSIGAVISSGVFALGTWFYGLFHTIK
jgi:hypothetical protein